MQWSLRFIQLVLPLLAILPLMPGCKDNPSASTADKPNPIVLGVNDIFCRQTHSRCVGDEGLRDYEGLVQQLREKTGLPITLKYYNTEAALVDAAGAGKLDGLICKTWPALQAASKSGRSLDRLADVTMPGGKPGVQGVVFTLADSPVKSLADLTGKTLATGGDDAYEKSFSARKLLAEQQIRPADTRVIPTCIESALAVKEERVVAAVLSSYAYDFGTLQVAGQASDFRELARTESIPFVTVAVFGTLPRAPRDLLHKAMMEVLGASPPADLGTSRLIAPQPWQPAELSKP